jgi:2,4-didehydro-3-deoxy-L-rhamnonate hydrolase
VVVPRGAEKLDYEVELAIILEKRGVHVEQTEVRNIIAGYTVLCDYSERAFQKERGGQWMKGKSCDTFAPAGPELVTVEEVGDVQDLGLWSKVNGEVRQDSRTSDMIFSVAEIVSYVSRFMTLLPGDVIATGTPAGVGAGFDPPRYLRAGDIVEMGIEGVGEIRQAVVAGE